MQTTILIIDAITTNRMVFKVAMKATWYDVKIASTWSDALEKMSKNRPDLIVVNMSVAGVDLSILRSFGTRDGNSPMPIIALESTNAPREALIRSGADAVITLPVDEAVLLARIRSLLRSSAAEAEWRLRDVTNRSLGFAEPALGFQAQVPVTLVNTQHARSAELLPTLDAQPGLSVRRMTRDTAMTNLTDPQALGVVILNLPEHDPTVALGMLAELRANPTSRHSAVFVLAPEGRSDIVSQALDFGADDADVHPVSVSEIAMRAQRLHQRQKITDSLRATVRTEAEAAIRDPLTCLYNRRYAMPYLERIADQARASGHPFAVMVADLDHFKNVNDWHGHAAGDSVLTEAARRMQENMRAQDLVARIGGEEFLIVLPNTQIDSARMAALRLCRKIAETPFSLPDALGTVPVTVSIGLTVSDGHHTPKTLLAQADKAMYRAKATGRNRFSLQRCAA